MATGRLLETALGERRQLDGIEFRHDRADARSCAHATTGRQLCEKRNVPHFLYHKQASRRTWIAEGLAGRVKETGVVTIGEVSQPSTGI